MHNVSRYRQIWVMLNPLNTDNMQFTLKEPDLLISCSTLLTTQGQF